MSRVNGLVLGLGLGWFATIVAWHADHSAQVIKWADAGTELFKKTNELDATQQRLFSCVNAMNDEKKNNQTLCAQLVQDDKDRVEQYNALANKFNELLKSSRVVADGYDALVASDSKTQSANDSLKEQNAFLRAQILSTPLRVQPYPVSAPPVTTSGTIINSNGTMSSVYLNSQ